MNPELPQRGSGSGSLGVSATALIPIATRLMSRLIALRDGPDNARLVDPYYRSRIDRSLVLMPYDCEVIDLAMRQFPPAEYLITEVGIGWGMLSICLSVVNYDVVGFVGDTAHAEVARHLRQDVAEIVPEVAARLRIVEGFFPDALRPEMLDRTRRNLLLLTNVQHSFTAANQQRILEAAQSFDTVMIETGTFGISRDEGERNEFRTGLGRTFTIRQNIWGGRILVMDSERTRAPGPLL